VPHGGCKEGFLETLILAVGIKLLLPRLYFRRLVCLGDNQGLRLPPRTTMYLFRVIDTVITLFLEN